MTAICCHVGIQSYFCCGVISELTFLFQLGLPVEKSKTDETFKNQLKTSFATAAKISQDLIGKVQVCSWKNIHDRKLPSEAK